MSSVQDLVELGGVSVFFGGGANWRRRGAVQAMVEVDLGVRAGETVGIVGESGCGKSTLARVIVGLQRPSTGTLRFEGGDVWRMSQRQRRRRLGLHVGMVFQDPVTSLNRRMTVRDILRDPLDVHRRGSRAERERRVVELLDLVGLPAWVENALPGQLSGGQRQRVAVARALALEPRVLVADEPTSALDVSVRAQILNLLLDLKRELGLAMIYVSHDIQTVRGLSDRVATMYLGRVVEVTPAAAVESRTRHPYTRALLSATPSLRHQATPIQLSGPPPSAINPPSGCPFRTRCWRASEACAERMPDPTPDPATPGHSYRCFHPVMTADDLAAAGRAG